MTILIVRRGDDIPLPIAWTAEDGTPYDLDDYEIDFVVLFGDTVYTYNTTNEGIEYTSAVDGEFTITLPRVDTDEWVGKGNFELRVTRILDGLQWVEDDGHITAKDRLVPK